MELIDFFAREWAVIAAAPMSFITGMVLFAVGGASFSRWAYKSIADTTKERLAAAQEDCARLREHNTHLRGEKDILVQMLEQHGADIAEIRRELAKRPRIHVGDEPPANAQDGDLWVVV